MKTYLRKTKIVGTIGPASENKLEELFEAGLNVTRVNYSHGSWEEQSEKTETIIKLREEKELPIALLLDMKGPEIRTGKDGSDEFCRAVKKLSYGQPYFVKSAFFCRTDKLLIRHFVGVIPSLSLKEALKLLTERKPDFSAISAMDLSGFSSKARFA